MTAISRTALTTPMDVSHSKSRLERVLNHWGALAWLLGLLGLLAGFASLFCYTHAIGRTDLFQAAAAHQSMLLVWLGSVGLMTIVFILIMASAAVLFALAVSMLNGHHSWQRRAINPLLFIVSAGYACFGGLILWRSDWGVERVAGTVGLVTALATLLLYLMSPNLHMPVVRSARKPKKGKGTSPWLLLLFLFLALMGTVVAGVFPAQMVLMAYRGEDTPDAVGQLMLTAVCSMILVLLPVWAFYKARGDLVRRWQVSLASMAGALLLYLMLSPATLGIITYAAANSMGMRDNQVRAYLLTDKDMLGELDTSEWSIQARQEGVARIEAFKLFGFGSVLLLCPAELVKTGLKDWPKHSERCLLTNTTLARLLPKRSEPA
ncbi:hypothetical protein [Phytopseudomonas dryadis]|uniref:Uncharacterized protein n=1 Tax=Phytopseudomonas dryadis TaxID=2487520 RepID=A0A4Q9QTU6_9GAMM|nr:hypothetical protein [Pseudomonas dryadis]TBU86369.1 hypothetical protein DNK44_23240 [Pseudomonas dryadis]